MSSTLTEKAVVGRRIELTYYRDLEKDNAPTHPGIITSIGQGSVWIRLDGKRYSLHARSNFQGLRYLDDVVSVPELPMGRFQPAAGDMLGVWEGVPLSTIGEDGEDLILLTTDREKAAAAAIAYDREVGVDVDCVDYGRLRACWAVFEWEPEDAEFPWTVRWDASDDEDQAVHIYYLPA